MVGNIKNFVQSGIVPEHNNIFYSDKDPKKLELVINTELKKVLDYCFINKLSVNMKINFMVISSKSISI
jgi:hypothetical protein